MTDTPTAEDAEAATPAPEPTETLFGVPVTRPLGDVVLHPNRDEYIAVVTAMRADGYWLCLDLCAVDYLGSEADRGLPMEIAPERFEVVVNLMDPTARTRVRVRVQVPESDPSLPTLCAVHLGVEASEREAFDLFGVVFADHPDMTRILMPEDWEGHPLRRDAAVGRIPVQFKAASNSR